MKVILLEDIRGTGKKDQIVEVSDGYGRNYLLPRKLAREATNEALNAIEKSKAAQKHREDVKRAEAEALKASGAIEDYMMAVGGEASKQIQGIDDILTWGADVIMLDNMDPDTMKEALSRSLKGKVVQLTAKGGEGGKLYGSITAQEIAQALKEQHGLEVDKRKIELDEPVRTGGQTLFTLRLAAGVSTRMLLNVTVTAK